MWQRAAPSNSTRTIRGRAASGCTRSTARAATRSTAPGRARRTSAATRAGDWVRGVIADPTTPRHFGGTQVTGMEPTEATAAELDTRAGPPRASARCPTPRCARSSSAVPDGNWKMAPFPKLSDAEVASVIAFVRGLAKH